jgi:iron complex transport system permease protein
MLFWLMGDLSQTGDPTLVLGVLAAVLLLPMPFARELNLLARGADLAQTLGVQVGRCAAASISSPRWRPPRR